ncbi:hypothetical protein VNO78_12524 [Psophocarpus tetragonolobus]|uniref:Uncharacterized protein n=1 Tax=Psophocarpus tetragonolobus TaxID=3891 RepID=A0AAN9SNH4_PSOTE
MVETLISARASIFVGRTSFEERLETHVPAKASVFLSRTLFMWVLETCVCTKASTIPDSDLDEILDDNIWVFARKRLDVDICVGHGKEGIKRKMVVHRRLILDHVFFSYVDISQCGKIREVDNQFNNITFKFKCYSRKIKGCGIFPIYDSTSGLKLVNSEQLLQWESMTQRDRPIILECSDDENEDYIEWPNTISQTSNDEQLECSDDENEDDLEWSDSISQTYGYEAHAKAIRAECSNNDIEDNEGQLHSASERQKTSIWLLSLPLALGLQRLKASLTP